MKSRAISIKLVSATIIALFLFSAIASASSTTDFIALSDKEVENIVRRSYQYVAMYNVNNKSALDRSNPMGTGGWNRVKANTALADHTLTLTYNDPQGVRQAFSQFGEQIACVIVEPVAGNMNCIPPAPGFLETLRSSFRQYSRVYPCRLPS